MEREPEGSIWPIAAAIGAMLLCCLGPVLFISGASGFVAWLGGVALVPAAGIAAAVCAVIVVVRRMRNSVVAATRHAPPTPPLKGAP